MARKGSTDQTHAGKRKPWQFMSKFDIKGADDSIYLRRWRIIQTPYFGIYLHKFFRGDSDPYVHDHPWAFISFVLRGGYTEMRRDNMTHKIRPRRINHVNVMRRDDAHYVIKLHRVPTWTLLFVGRRRRTWGFYMPQRTEILATTSGGVAAVHVTGPVSGEAIPNQVWVEFDNWEGR